jgi:hypothetical protein
MCGKDPYGVRLPRESLYGFGAVRRVIAFAPPQWRPRYNAESATYQTNSLVPAVLPLLRHTERLRLRMALILSVSYDSDLLLTRQLLLEAQGYKVISALGISEAMKQCQSGTKFALFILGHSIPREHKAALVTEFHARCAAPIVALQGYDEELIEGADFAIEPEPEKLLALVKRVLSGNAASA